MSKREEHLPLDPSPSFDKLCAALVKLWESDDFGKEVLKTQIVAKSLMCNEGELENWYKSIESMNLSDEMRNYILYLAKLGFSFANRHSIEHSACVDWFVTHYPSDLLLEREFCNKFNSD